MNSEELRQIAEDEQQRQRSPAHRIGVCTASGCLSCRSAELLKALRAEADSRPELSCRIEGVGCMGLCSQGPLVKVESQERLYRQLTPGDLPALLDSLDPDQSEATESLADKNCDLNQPFFQRQVKVVLDQFERIDPERIESYLAAGGYRSLLNCLHHRAPAAIIDEINRSGLRGRGGGGYPTGLKWATVAKAGLPGHGTHGAGGEISTDDHSTSPSSHAGWGARKYVICNADEGDPGAFMDRSVLESAPHRVLEGMAIAAYAVGADFGYIYVRAEYPLAVQRLRKAITQAEKFGLLGNNVGGSAFHFKVEIRLGAGAFVCGEETALIASIEGRRGQPRPRPPYPAEHGLWGCPTLINNVETFANVPAIIDRGAEWYAGMGTATSKGTKVFALAGKVNNTGLIEVPMGISLGEIVNEMGGGAPEGNEIKAVQTGGPSGGCIPAAHFTLPVDYESLQAEGSIMGSGGMIIMDQQAGMVDVARFFMEFCVDESCGKCTPCRVGTKQILLLLDKIGAKQADSEDLRQLEELCQLVKNTSLCGLGQSAPNPVLSTLRFFRNEYQLQNE